MVAGSVKVRDAAGHASNTLSLGEFTFQTSAPAAPKPRLGGTGIDNTEYNAFEAACTPPGLWCRRVFDGSAVPASFAASKMGPEATSGVRLLWSWKPSLTNFPTNTALKTQLFAFFDTFPWATLTEVILTDWHEPEDNIAAGTFTLAQWKASINALAGWVVEYTTTHPAAVGKLKTCFILMGAWTFDSTSPYSAYDMTTGWAVANLDYIGLDPYRFKQSEPAMSVQLTQPNYGRTNPPAGQKSPMAALLPLGLPFLLPEWASTESAPVTQQDKADWIAAAYAWMVAWNTAHPTQPIVYAPYFNTDNFANTGSQPTATWALDTPTTFNAYKAALADSRS